MRQNDKGTGWRLPTVSEWYQLVGRFGIAENGKDDTDAFLEKLQMKRNGWYNGGLYAKGTDGNWWSSTATSGTNAYNMYVYASNLNPQNSNNKLYGFSLRCVKSIPEKEDTK